MHGRLPEILRWLRGPSDLKAHPVMLSVWGMASCNSTLQDCATDFNHVVFADLLRRMDEDGELPDGSLRQGHRLLHKVCASTHANLMGVSGI